MKIKHLKKLTKRLPSSTELVFWDGNDYHSHFEVEFKWSSEGKWIMVVKATSNKRQQ